MKLLTDSPELGHFVFNLGYRQKTSSSTRTKTTTTTTKATRIVWFHKKDAHRQTQVNFGSIDQFGHSDDAGDIGSNLVRRGAVQCSILD